MTRHDDETRIIMSYGDSLKTDDLRKLLDLVRCAAISGQQQLAAFDRGAYETKDGEVREFDEDSFCDTMMTENLVASYRVIAHVGERIRRTLQPHWQGFEAGQDLLKEEKFGPQPPLPRDERPKED